MKNIERFFPPESITEYGVERAPTPEDQVILQQIRDNIVQGIIAREAMERAHRDALLAESDWREMAALREGVPLAPEWAAYRQALRDVTEQDDFPITIVWPEKPA